jgi:hypothetical protein
MIVACKDRMPTLIATPTKEIAPRKSGPPPDLSAALELLFFLWEQHSGESAPTPAWFLMEAFSALQQRNFKASPPLQHFLQSLLGPSYCGAEAVETYYITVLFAAILRTVYTEDVGSMGICRWCLMHWGVREGRDEIERQALKWRRRVLEVWSTLPAGQGPNEMYERGHRLLEVMRLRGPKLAKKIREMFRK